MEEFASGEHYSFSVPESFIDVKKPTESLVDKSYASPDHFLVITTATDKTTYPIELYAMGLAMAMEEGGAALVDHRMGRWAGMKAILLIVGVARRFIVMHYLAKDDKNNVYMMSCALSPLFLKQYAPVCAAISRTFTLASAIAVISVIVDKPVAIDLETATNLVEPFFR